MHFLVVSRKTFARWQILDFKEVANYQQWSQEKTILVINEAIQDGGMVLNIVS